MDADVVWRAAALVIAPCIGSFIGLLTLRLPCSQPVMFNRSTCAGCRRTLGKLDLVPLLSFTVAGGRCRDCRVPIPRRYLLLEAGCLLIALWAIVAVPGRTGAITAVLGWWLLLIAMLDAEHFWLPDGLTLPLIVAGWLTVAVVAPSQVTGHLIGAATGYASLTLINAAYRHLVGCDGIGDGDPRLFAAAGAWIGWAGLPSVLLWASAAGLIVRLANAARFKPLQRNDRLPFGTYLALGLWLTWLYGPVGVQ